MLPPSTIASSEKVILRESDIGCFWKLSGESLFQDGRASDAGTNSRIGTELSLQDDYTRRAKADTARYFKGFGGVGGQGKASSSGTEVVRKK